MRNLVLAVSVLIALALVASPATSQSKMALSVGGDVLLPIGTFADHQSMGFGGSVRGQYDVTPEASVGLTVGYYTWGGKDYTESGFTVSGVSFKGIPVRVFGKYYFTPQGKTRVYGIAELGLFFGSVADQTMPNPLAGFPGQPANITVEGGSSSDFNYAPGIGAEFQLGEGKTLLDISARYDGIATSPSAGSLGARVAVKFPLGQ